MTVAGFPDLSLVRPLVEAALAEDVGGGDATTAATVSPHREGEGEILVREDGILCGLPVARETFHVVDPALVFEADAQDGSQVENGQCAARVRGRAASILTAERTALNFLQHLSGIATATGRAVALLEGTRTRLLDTRKTVPGLRFLAKYAVRCGGGVNHRMGLYDMILIKENHLTAAGGVRRAIEAARRHAPSLHLEVEVTTLAELEEALAAGPDRILLDNFDPRGIRRAVEHIRTRCAKEGASVPEVEISGGITAGTIRDYAVPGVDFISSGAITHSAPALDLSLELRLLGASGDEEAP
jgi:nicotinate-nucleotide pyrophosphorylase (carboxylating)